MFHNVPSYVLLSSFTFRYVRKHFNEDSKLRINEMVKDIRKEMEIILTDIDWMDDKTKERAKEKLTLVRHPEG